MGVTHADRNYLSICPNMGALCSNPNTPRLWGRMIWLGDPLSLHRNAAAYKESGWHGDCILGSVIRESGLARGLSDGH
jgi:hypothetical protein